MKSFKKLLALNLALIMLISCALTGTAFAADDTVTYHSEASAGETETGPLSGRTLGYETFTKEGNILVGWSTEPDGAGTKYEFNAYILFDTATDLYAIWEESTMDEYVLYFANKSSKTTGNPDWYHIVYNTDGSITLEGNTFERTVNNNNLTLLKWNTSPGGTGTAYEIGAVIAQESLPLVLYAQWGSRITYNGNGGTQAGTGSLSQIVTENGNTENTYLGDFFEKEGYEFAGWNTASDGNETWYASGRYTSYYSGDLTLYAQWVEQPDYAYVKLYGNDYIFTDETTPLKFLEIVDDKITLPGADALTITASEHTLVGWYKNDNVWDSYYGYFDSARFTKESVLDAQQGDTYYAYVGYEDTVVFDGNGGTHITGGNAMFMNATNGSLEFYFAKDFTQSGKTLSNWNVEKDGSGQSYGINTSLAEENINFNALYAQWTDIVYVVPPTAPSTTLSITVNSPANGSVSLNSTAPKAGDTIVVTAKPNEGFVLDGISITGESGTSISYISNGNGIYSFIMPDENVSVSVTFIAEDEAETRENPFNDVVEDNWYYDAVKYVYENGIMQGTGEDFEPNISLSRAMMAQMLWNLVDNPAVDGSGFADVSNDAWYHDAIIWISENNIASGYNENSFGPDDPINREQMAVMLYNYCQYAGIELPIIRTGSFADDDSISPWAKEALAAMYQAGILNGKGDGIFDPQGTVTRAEVAQMFMNFLEAIK